MLELSNALIELAMIEQQKETFRALRKEPLTQIPHFGISWISFAKTEGKSE